MTQDAYVFKYKYNRYQNANHDIVFTEPVITYLDPPEQEVTVEATASSAQSEQSQQSTISTKKLGEKAAKKLSDNTSLLEGSYMGSGKLTKNKETIEEYSTITVKVKSINKNTVAVNVVESNGDKFFANDSQYDVTRGKDGSYILTNKAVRDAKITISATKKLTYDHPRVNIEGEIYHLTVRATKK